MSIFDNFSRKELEDVLHKHETWAGIVKDLGVYDKHNKMVPLLKRRLDELGIDYSFMGKTPICNKPGHYRNQFNKFTDEEVFKRNNGLSIRAVRRAFLEHKEIPYECAICHLPAIWQGKPLVLTMDHIDGDTDNNEFSNLRWVCPNCDRQLPTYASRNRVRRNNRPPIPIEERRSGKNIYPKCGKEKWADAKLCESCYKIASRKVERPAREVLKDEIRSTPMLTLGKKYGVSDAAIRKWCKSYDLPYQSLKIKKISDEEWEKI